jgi:hypothetical protein
MRGEVVLWSFQEQKGEERREVAHVHAGRRRCPVGLPEGDEGRPADRVGLPVSEGGEGEGRVEGGGPRLGQIRSRPEFKRNSFRISINFRIWQNFGKLHKEI